MAPLFISCSCRTLPRKLISSLCLLILCVSPPAMFDVCGLRPPMLVFLCYWGFFFLKVNLIKLWSHQFSSIHCQICCGKNFFSHLFRFQYYGILIYLEISIYLKIPNFLHVGYMHTFSSSLNPILQVNALSFFVQYTLSRSVFCSNRDVHKETTMFAIVVRYFQEKMHRSLATLFVQNPILQK